MRKFLRTADASGNIVNGIPRGIGFAIVPSGTTPGGFPSGMTVDFQGTSWGAHPVIGPDVEFFPDPFVVGHIRGATPNGQYLCYSFQDRREDARISTQTAQNTQLVTLTDTGQAYNSATNDPGVSRGDNGVGALGLDVSNASWARFLFKVASSTFNGGGNWRLWVYDYSLGLWFLNKDFLGPMPNGVASFTAADQQIGVGWGRIYAEMLNVTAAAGSPALTAYSRVGRGA